MKRPIIPMTAREKKGKGDPPRSPAIKVREMAENIPRRIANEMRYSKHLEARLRKMGATVNERPKQFSYVPRTGEFDLMTGLCHVMSTDAFNLITLLLKHTLVVSGPWDPALSGLLCLPCDEFAEMNECVS